MYAWQIDKTLSRDANVSPYFLGCFPADCIPKSTANYPHCMVINFDESGQPGSHWVAAYVQSPHQVEYFDSLALPPNASIAKFLAGFSKRTMNPTPLQSSRSSVCGRYAIYFLSQRCKGKSFNDIIRHLLLRVKQIRIE